MLAENEVRANVGTAKNDGYYQLGLEAAAVIRQAIANGCPVVHTTAKNLSIVIVQSKIVLSCASDCECAWYSSLEGSVSYMLA